MAVMRPPKDPVGSAARSSCLSPARPIPTGTFPCLWILIAIFAATGPSELLGQAQRGSNGATTVTLVPGARYDRGKLHRAIFGQHYRDVWATAVRVPVLDLSTFAGGLTPVRAHAGSQTRSVRFQGADGRTYQFRSVDKDPLAALTPELQRTLAADVLQDGVSSSYPYASLVASALMEAAGVLHVDQTLAVLPDDAGLGEFRDDFKGMFGMIEERPDENDDESASFAGAIRVISPTRLFERIQEGPSDLVDARAFLVARLTDIFMGDRDRHRDQFRWAQFVDGEPRMWQPISRDHDEAFVKIDGPALGILQLYFPQLVAFGPEYPNPLRLNWHSREVDRRFLVGLDRAVWDSTAVALQATFTDAVIDDAVRRVPPEAYEVSGPFLTHALETRRDRLRDEALRYYAILAEQVEIHATDAQETAEITRVDDRWLDVTITERREGARPYFSRRFDDTETRELTLRMWGKDDRILVNGDGDPDILVRVVGGHGDDTLTVSGPRGGVRFYDSDGENQATPKDRVRLNTKPYEEWIGSDLDRYPPREWGSWARPLVWVGASTDLGLFLGGGVRRTTYGFRRSPYASDLAVRGGVSTAAAAVRFELTWRVQRENSGIYGRFHARASGLEILRYYGPGNDSEAPESSTFYKVSQQFFIVDPRVVFPTGPRGGLSIGLLGSWSHTGENPGRFIATVADTLYGAGDFGQIGVTAGWELDTRDGSQNPRSGVYVSAQGRVFPGLWSVSSTFGGLRAEGSAYVSARGRFGPTLALRAGAHKVWGTFPFHESAFLGGRESVRGLPSQRFAGDLALFGGVDVRQPLTRFFVLLPGDLGITALADVGRVYLDGDSPGGWHTGLGGGLWTAFRELGTTLDLEVVWSRERTTLYLATGFAF